MKERLLGLLFVGALLVAVWDFIADKLHQKLFADSVWLQTHWYVPYVIVPLAAGAALVTAGGGFALGWRRARR